MPHSAHTTGCISRLPAVTTTTTTTTTTTEATTTEAAAAIEAAVGTPRLPTVGASFGFVGISFVRMILLVVSSKYETLIALYTG